MTEEEAVAACGDVDVYTSSFRPMKGTISGNEQRELMKVRTPRFLWAS
jgi:glutathione reductase (NADPH)